MVGDASVYVMCTCIWAGMLICVFVNAYVYLQVCGVPIAGGRDLVDRGFTI